MKKIIALIVLFIIVIHSCCYANSILPVLSDPEADKADADPITVVMPGLQQVSWYEPNEIIKNKDDKIVYTYLDVSENAYQKLGIALSEAGYELKSDTTDENDYMHFVVGDDTNEMEIVYHEIGGTMDIIYPKNAVPAERDEEALTIRLELGDSFKKTEDCVFSLVSAQAVSDYSYEYESGLVVIICETRERSSSETCQYVILGYTCENQAVYKIEGEDNKFYYGKLEYDQEEPVLNDVEKGGSNESYSYINSYSLPWVDGNSTRYYARCVSYDPTLYSGPISFAVTFLSDDMLLKYRYDITIDVDQ